MWFNKLFKNKKKQNSKHSDAIIKCPRCNINMKKVEQRDVVIDICKKCNGMWLDDGEIERLANLANED